MEVTALLIKHEVCLLEDIWPYLKSSAGEIEGDAEDEIELLLKMQNEGLAFLYELMFKTITNAEGFDREMRE